MRASIMDKSHDLDIFRLPLLPDIQEIGVLKHHEFGSGLKVNKLQFEHRQTLHQERLKRFVMLEYTLTLDLSSVSVANDD